jgi:hypothetical protein
MSDAKLDEDRIDLYGLATMLAIDGVPESIIPRALLAARLDKIKPSIPFDIEPRDPFAEEIAVSLDVTRSRAALRQRYEDVRLWHRLREMIR